MSGSRDGTGGDGYPRPVEFGPVMRVPIEMVERADISAFPVPINTREGVYVHSFVCNVCRLHFNVYSWRANRHDASNVTCPECGQQGRGFVHFRINVEDGRAGHGAEIFRHCPLRESELMDDSTFP